MATIYSNSKLFSALCIVFIAVVDIVIVAVVQPYRYGFVSCFKGEDNNTEILFEKIELYRVYDKQQPTIIPIDQPDYTQKSEYIDNHSDLFTQHFDTKKNVIKTKHQGLVQAGEVLNHTKLFLFNNNSRRIANLTTLVIIEFVFICTQIYADEINRSYSSLSIQIMLPLLINLILVLNVGYNYVMIVLQIMDRNRHNSARVDVEPDSATTQFNNDLFTRHLEKKENVEMTSPVDSQMSHARDIFQSNQLIIKSNSSIYDLKRPQIVKSAGKGRKHQLSGMIEITE